MPFRHRTHLKSSLPFGKANVTTPFSTFLVAGLLGIHLTLLAVGSFCALGTIHPNPSQHAEHGAPTSMLCIWACHVGQVAASATPTEILSVLPILIILWILFPSIHLTVFQPFGIASPRGPPFL